MPGPNNEEAIGPKLMEIFMNAVNSRSPSWTTFLGEQYDALNSEEVAEVWVEVAGGLTGSVELIEKGTG